MNYAIHTRRVKPKNSINVHIEAWYSTSEGKTREFRIHPDPNKSEFLNHIDAAFGLAQHCGFVARDWFHAVYHHNLETSGWVFLGMPGKHPQLMPTFSTHKDDVDTQS